MNVWSNIEVELTVADYFEMLSRELEGLSYNKAEHRRKLQPLLNNRSEGSIEFKHQNISAVLVNLEQPYIKGYLPRFNYQKILEDEVIHYLTEQHVYIEELFKQFADEGSIEHPAIRDFNHLLVNPPERSKEVMEPMPAYTKSPIKINYLEREQMNRRLGYLGEQLVIDYEKWYLSGSGKNALADRVRWVSKEEGDGAGFDILSRNLDGTDKYIEVKTTKLGKETPFYFTRNELLFSKERSTNYHLYRLYNFAEKPRMFDKNGSLDTMCSSIPMNFKGFF